MDGGPETRLPGGNVGGAVRAGDTVRRAAGPWTPTVQALLSHLRTRGFTAAPIPLGIDEDGREVLRFIPGDVPAGAPLPEWTRSDEALIGIARLIRAFHDATRDFAPRHPTWQRLPGAPSDPEVICHNDLAPYNTVYDRGRPVAVIDWDHAAPGPRAWDLAHAAWRFIPLDAGTPAAEGARRLRLLCDAYGLRRRSGLVDMIALRQQVLHDTVREFAAAGMPAYVAMWGTHHSEQPLRDRQHLLAHRAAYDAALE